MEVDSALGIPSNFTPPPHRRRAFTLVCLSMFCNFMTYGVLTPFFPNEAALKGVPSSHVGGIFGIMELAVICATPRAVKAQSHIGSKSILVMSCAWLGITNIALGMCWYVDNGFAFSGLCLVLRMAAGLGFSMGSTASYGLVPGMYGDMEGTASGALELAIGSAVILGPLFGSAFFSLGGEDGFGFVLPFLALGSLQLLFALFNVIALPPLPNQLHDQPSLTNFSWKVIVPFINAAGVGFAFGFLDPILQPHLSAPPLNYSVLMVGSWLAVTALSYALISPIIHGIDDYSQGRYSFYMMGFGNLICTVACIIFGPLTLGSFQLVLSDATCWIAAIVFGAACGGAFGPSYRQILHQALHEDVEERDAASGALLIAAYSLGAFLGPVVAGALSEVFGNGGALVCLGVMFAVLGTIKVVRGITHSFESVTPGSYKLLAEAKS